MSGNDMGVTLGSIYPHLIAVAAVLVPLAVAFCIWRAVTSARTPQGAVAWVVFLLAAPWFALPSYAILGHHKVRGYKAARRDSRRVVKALADFADEHPVSQDADLGQGAFERLADMPAVGGNSVDLLIDGDDAFAAMMAAMDRAEHYLLVQFYTFADDDLGGRFADRLIAAAARGVTVRVMYDGVGSYGLSSAYTRRLRDGGIETIDPHEARGPTSRRQVNFRNHRKTIVIDGREGFVGGLNVADDYVGKGPFGHWRDTHLALRGPVVAQLQLIFAEDWHWATGHEIGPGLDWRPVDEEANLAALIVPCGPGDDFDTGALFFAAAIAEARERLWIASPYFVPDAEVLSALKVAALRGVDVRVLVPDVADHTLPWLAAFAYFDEIRAAGVKVWRYTSGFTHQKVVLIDDRIAAVGTANFDNRSFRLNFETMAMVFDGAFAGRVAAMLEADIARALPLEKDLSEQKWKVRLGAPLARLLSPVL
ncbi:cardiolipin synthase [Salipiger sp.]|uniref:cardiolipin synthase n=1 Tax=Salipiger sp. TaxID=2078585 RepID=UPI003A97D16B